MDNLSISAALESERKDPSGGGLAIQAPDPIDELLAMGIAPRLLISHQLVCMDWLAAHRLDRFRLCYYDNTGAVVTETMGANQLLSRAREIGWQPVEDPMESGAGCHLFEEASYNLRRGVHWYASAHDTTDEMLPLGFPQVALRAGLERQLRRDAAAARRFKSVQQEAAKRAREKARQSTERLAEYLLRDPPTDGPDLRSMVQARRAARELISDTIARLKGSR
ncbi:hypothetical protein WH218_19620 [Stenotrophomonas indicatrix]|uniref:hypothetical protein n=1 Tax=Stenotrophomonas indicatrix TaxID=2045451 RepID=UPI0015DF1AAC|nr:hypothetical protein [Stenotrophomonas indicatrix]MBA0101243.1 hypothetical protein [Stenotrophomonas indicatrix]